MTKLMMDLSDLVEKSTDADLLLEMIGIEERLMEREVGAKTGAGYHEKSPERMAQGNCYRERDWQKRASNVELRIPKLRTGSYFSSRTPRQIAQPSQLLVPKVAERRGRRPANLGSALP